MSNRDLACCGLFGVAGGLLGYGIYGTVMAACFGGGLGLVAIPVLLILAAAMGGMDEAESEAFRGKKKSRPRPPQDDGDAG